MGHKTVCFSCKKAFSFYHKDIPQSICPQCGGEVKIYSHRFRPPAKNDADKWAVVELLSRHHFYFQHIDEIIEEMDEVGRIKKVKKPIPYPTNLREAKEFVVQYASLLKK